MGLQEFLKRQKYRKLRRPSAIWNNLWQVKKMKQQFRQYIRRKKAEVPVIFIQFYQPLFLLKWKYIFRELTKKQLFF